MRSNSARRALLVSMTVLLAVLVLSYARRSVEREMEIESRYPRQNLNLSLEMDGDGVIRVEGEGKLYSTDMKAMLKEKGIHSKAVLHVIIGDGITELGYDVLANRKYLITLKIGDGVKRIEPGAVQNCAQLQYVYLPSGVEKIGGGFLLNCNDCLVITDGSAEDLPDLENVEEGRLAERVDAYETLLATLDGDGSLPRLLKRWWP